MFCTRCGNSPVSTKFCPRCGHPMPGRPAPAQTGRAAPGRSVPPPPPDFVLHPHTPEAAGAPPDDQSHAAPQGRPEPARPIPGSGLQGYIPGQGGLFSAIQAFFFDTDTFFARADFELDLAKCFYVIMFVTFVTGASQAVLMSTRISSAAEKLDAVLMQSLISVAYPFALSLFGMILIRVLFHHPASWKTIFGIYAFSTLAYLPAVLPACFMPLICSALYAYYVHKGFENVFGLGSGAAWMFAIGIPLCFWLIIAMTVGVPLFLHAAK